MVTYTSASSYWAPLKPRIRIYALNDSAYASPIYTYDAFTDSGNVNKPVALHFESQTTHAGTFMFEIEDSGNNLSVDDFMKGNRVFIEASKDGVTYNPAFKGLVRSSDQKIYPTSGRNIVLNGYSTLVRLNERILKVVQQASVTGGVYNRTDTTMNTNNLVTSLLNTDADYIYSVDDITTYSFLKSDNVASSPVDTWLPKLDAQLVTLGSAIDTVLAYSNSMLTVDFSNDELMLYNPQNITSATAIFLLTDQINQSADDANITMYPVDQYKYNVSYDYPDSGSRLIVSYKSPNTAPATTGSANCPAVPETTPDAMLQQWTNTDYINLSGTNYWRACQFVPSSSPLLRMRLGLNSTGNLSGKNTLTMRFYNDNGSSNVGTQLSGSPITFYRESASTGEPTTGTAFPSSTTNAFAVGQLSGTTGPSFTLDGRFYWMAIADTGSISSTNDLGWIQTGSGGNSAFSSDSGSSWTNLINSGGPWNRFAQAAAGQAACGGAPSVPASNKDVFAVGQDRNMSNRLGIVEKAITSLSPDLIDLQTINEFLYNQLYLNAKPRFTFDYNWVTVPNKLPRAGDIVTHVSKLANVGLRSSPIQTGVITGIVYDFAQGSDDVLGLRKFGISTTGIRRGYY